MGGGASTRMRMATASPPQFPTPPALCRPTGLGRGSRVPSWGAQPRAPHHAAITALARPPMPHACPHACPWALRSPCSLRWPGSPRALPRWPQVMTPQSLPISGPCLHASCRLSAPSGHTLRPQSGAWKLLSAPRGSASCPQQPRPPHTRQVTRQRAWGQQSEERNLDHPLSQCNPSPLRRNPRPAGDSGTCSAPGHDCAHGLPTQGCSA